MAADVNRNAVLLNGLRIALHIIELEMLAVMRNRRIAGPQAADQFHAFFKERLVVVEAHVEGQVFAAIIAAAGGEIDAASAEQIERGPLLGDADGMMQRQHGDGGGEAWRRWDTIRVRVLFA